MEQTVLVRLVAARHLIESSGPDPTGSSPPLLIAQKVLAAHDSSELVFLALASLPGITPKGNDGQVIKDPAFMKLAQTVINYATQNSDFQAGSCVKLFEDLNEARKIFKHSGILVDPDSNAHLFGDVVAALDELCAKILDEPLLQISQASAISSQEARTSFTSAREAMVNNQFKLSLEHTARGLAASFWDISTPSLTVGKPSSEEALLLSGRGIDPAAFLSMQQLLPIVYYHSGEINWNLRKFGHEANWTYHVALSCLETAIGVAARLQAIPNRPAAVEFYDVYEDVVVVTSPDPEIYLTRGHCYSFESDEQSVPNFRIGDHITGHATGRIERNSLTTDNEVEFDCALWIAVTRPRTERILFDDSLSTANTLWFRSEQVQISYQESVERARLRDIIRRNSVEQTAGGE